MADEFDDYRRQFLDILQPYVDDVDNPDRITLLSNSFNVALALGDLGRGLELYAQVSAQVSGSSASQYFGTFKYMTRRLSDVLAPNQVRSAPASGDEPGSGAEGDHEEVLLADAETTAAATAHL